MQLRVRQVYATLQVAGSYRGKSKQELGTETMQEEDLVAGFFMQSRTICLGNDATHNWLGPPTSMDNEDNQFPADMATDQSDPGNPSIETPFLGDSRLCQV